MPRFYFDTHDDDRFIPDNEGHELAGLSKPKPSRPSQTWLMTHSPAVTVATSWSWFGTRGRQVVKATLSLVVEPS